MAIDQRKVTVTLPQGLIDRLNQVVPSRKRSLFITEAIEAQLDLIEQITALEETAGAWSLENHSDMKDETGIDKWLQTSRQSWSNLLRYLLDTGLLLRYLRGQKSAVQLIDLS